ncbi:hypothetical protein FRB94_008978 [Tulasnella sp. JGI-2019a]|nr:hypothetical protein FRB93_003492 [Tulasnella sp. JGI-2019a]KAG9014820.1 hypothetical protein FRB94_008978 [Tulasnella sp. JGI-2019a]KAG9040019.1 hypothetical protein FRB95_004491 [Tulasnella sp. JGI-2019a]
MSSNNANDSNIAAPSPPINITTTRGRRGSIASSIPALSTSPTSPLPASIQTPASSFTALMSQHSRANSEDSAKGGPGGSPTSPLAYFLGAASPKFKGDNGNGGGFFGGSVTQAIDEDDDGPPNGGTIGLFGMGHHTRRASWAQNTITTPTPQTNDRGTSVLRRLSLSSPFQRPTFNLPSAPPSPDKTRTSPRRTPPTVQQPKGQSLKRAATIGGDHIKKRGISPVGERMLKGHFDGF